MSIYDKNPAKVDERITPTERLPNSPYADARKLYWDENAGEPVVEDGWTQKESSDPGPFFGMFPSYKIGEYEILDDPILIKKKAEIRAALKEEYLRKAYNPYRHAAGIGGLPFDPNVQRYISTMRKWGEYMRPSTRFTLIGLASFVLPGYLLWREGLIWKECQERKYRGGLVAYKDRKYKFIM